MNKFYAVGQVWLADCKTRPFGVPLHAEDGFFCMFQRFDSIVGCGLRDRKTASDAPAALVMGAVDNAGISIETVHDGAWNIIHRMKLVMPGILMSLAGRKILDDISAEIYIDHLQAFADTKHRFPGPDESIQKVKLGVIDDRVYCFRAKIGLPESSGMNIPAAREQEFIIGRNAAGAERCIERNRKEGQRFFVICRLFGDAGN